MKPLVQQFYETKATHEMLGKQLDRIKVRLDKRVHGNVRLNAGPFWVKRSERAECKILEHTRKACVVWETGVGK